MLLFNPTFNHYNKLKKHLNFLERIYYHLPTYNKNLTFSPISCAKTDKIISTNHAHTKTLLFVTPLSYRNKHSKHITIQ